MDSIELYSKALAEFKAKNFDAALKIVDELKILEPTWKKPFLLEAYILRGQGRLVDLVAVAEELLSRLDVTLPDERALAADAFNVLGMACSRMAMPEAGAEFLTSSARTSKNNAEACTEISNALFAAVASEKFSRADFDALYAEYKSFLSDVEPFKPKSYAHEKIRVGFMSADFHQHPVIYWSWDLLTRLNKNFFATYFYSTDKHCDVVTKHLQTVGTWRDISDLTDFDAAKLIRDDEIDILVDLSGHTADNRLRVAAYKPAPVQISGIGYVNSTGLDCFDYFLSDVHCAGDESWFTEKLIRLPNSHICYAPPPGSEVSVPPHMRNGFVTFGSFNNYSKITDTILVAWKKILDSVPESRLVLKHSVFGTPDCRGFISKRLESFGFDLARVEMRGFTANYLDDYADVDVALDTFPYTGGVTTCEALWMGVPVVSLYGDRHGSRFGLSMLSNVGLDELAVATVDEYISRAVMLAGDSELLNLLRRNLRNMMKNSPLMNGDAYVREVEKVFAQILVDARPTVV